MALIAGLAATNIALGSLHTCAIRSDGSVVCWGGNSKGQLGIGSTESIGTFPQEMGNNLTAVDLGTGEVAVQVTQYMQMNLQKV
jgi:alpha-tubulin suppressor-like RCC1 family protein